ncbi:MAG: leucine--tRNA ligase [Acidobacteriota bacterium]|nr:leucine--tRNA ligase [Acidobacteriota bacterium]
MDEKYFAQKIERKWQRHWAENKTFETDADETRKKYYALEMLPYPSGRLHMGHVRNYSIGDALAWYKRLQGFNVLHPIGWDSFGQPAEQAAIKKGVNPREWTEDNINQMRAQLQKLGFSYDWRREIAAHRPEYYKFDQWFFLKMLELGLAYKKMTQVNWCPKDLTTLSNEQASGGVCWRCGTAVEKKDLAQWFFRITKYAEELLKDMSEIESGWAERVLTMQKHWIGKSEGAFVEFQIADSKFQIEENAANSDLAAQSKSNLESGIRNLESIRVFTTRIDTIYGVNALVVAAEHPIIEAHKSELSADVLEKIEQIKIEKAKPTEYGEEVEKDGVDTGLKAVNPFSGETLPVWVGNYVMMEYGTGAVMSVPAHDERDFEFANKFGLPIVEAVESEESKIQNLKSKIEQAFTDYGVLINSGNWSGKSSAEAKKEMTEYSATHNFGEAATTYRLRDWGISRQRFWGAPIPIVYCESCGAVPEKYENLPIELPETAPFTGVGESPLAKVPEFVNTKCPNCGEDAKRETDTMDTFVDSSWYYFRYTDPHNTDAPFESKIANYWLPVDQYIGGVDHAVMHLLYTRFWTKVMRDIGLVNFDEPVKSLLTQGMVVGESFYSESKASYIAPDEVEIKRDDKGKALQAVLIEDDSPIKVAVEKMSKSKYNGVDPDDMIAIYGADAVRIFALFAAPAENELVWQETGIEGAVRFLQRVYRFVYKWKEALPEPSALADGLDATKNPSADAGGSDNATEAKNLRRKTHQTIKRITENFESHQFNTPVAALMELSNALGDFKIEPNAASDAEKFAVREALESLMLMLAPYAPHFAEEIWEVLTNDEKGILSSGAMFPIADESLAKASEIEIPVQVNGKLRGRLTVAPETSKEDLEQSALTDAKVREYIDGKQIVKVIVVAGRLVNIVVK